MTAERAREAAAAALQKHEALIRDIDRRRDLNAQLAGELMGTQQRLQATLRDRFGCLPRDRPIPRDTGGFGERAVHCVRGELEWPAAGPFVTASASPRQPPASSPTGSRLRPRRARRSPPSTRARRLRRHLLRLRQAGHPGPRRAGLQPLRQFARYFGGSAAPACPAATGWQRPASLLLWRPAACTSSCASTVGRSIPYNGLGSGSCGVGIGCLGSMTPFRACAEPTAEASGTL